MFLKQALATTALHAEQTALKLLWCDDQRTWRGGRAQNILGSIVLELKVSMQISMEYVSAPPPWSDVLSASDQVQSID